MALKGERRDERDGLENGTCKEVDVGIAAELKDEGEGKEGDDVVLGGGDVVGVFTFPFGTSTMYYNPMLILSIHQLYS